MLEQLTCINDEPLRVPVEKSSKVESDHEKQIDTLGRKKERTINNKARVDPNQCLSEKDTTLYRAVAARANYLTTDRADISYAVKEACRRMGTPTYRDLRALERIARYLMYYKIVKQWFVWQPDQRHLIAYTDTDWAGCPITRKSTTGGCVRHGQHTLRTWCKTQGLIALSSCEAELYGAVKASSELLGMIASFADFGMSGFTGEVLGNANAALGIIHRQGVGRLRHLDTNWLWIQECAAENRLQYSKVHGSQNVADLFTKALEHDVITKHMESLGNEFADAKVEGETVKIIDGCQLDFIGARPCNVDVRSCINMLGICNGKFGVWTRTDLQTKTYRTTMRGGPEWKTVVARIAACSKTGEVLNFEEGKNITSSLEHGLVHGGPRDLQTILFYEKEADKSGARIEGGAKGKGTDSTTTGDDDNLRSQSPRRPNPSHSSNAAPLQSHPTRL